MSEPATLLVADDDPGTAREPRAHADAARATASCSPPTAGPRSSGSRRAASTSSLSDLKMPGLTGLELLRAAKAIAPDVDVILLTAFGTVEEAVQGDEGRGLRLPDQALPARAAHQADRKALERRELIEKNKALQQRLDDLLGQGTMIGASPAFRRMMTLVEQVADSSATVLIQGESGTGKECVARAIHERSPRRERAVRGGQLRRAARERCSSPSCSATRRARSPARPAARRGASSWPTAARCSSTRSPTSRP